MIPRSSFYKKRCAIRRCRTYPAYVPPASARPGGADTARMQHKCGTIGAKRGTNRPRHIKPLHYSRFPVYKDTK